MCDVSQAVAEASLHGSVAQTAEDSMIVTCGRAAVAKCDVTAYLVIMVSCNCYFPSTEMMRVWRFPSLLQVKVALGWSCERHAISVLRRR